MKSKLFLVIFVFFNIIFVSPLGYSQGTELLLLLSDDVETETSAYKNRVTSDNGYIQSSDYLNNFIKTAKNQFLNDIKFWVSSEWGLKVESDKILKQYDLKGNDLTSPEIENYPSLKLNELFGLNGIYYSGNKQFCDNSTLAVEHPMTLILVFQQTDGMHKEALLDTKDKKEHSILFDDVSVDPVPLSIEIGKKTVIGNIGSTKSFLYFEFNGDSSKVLNNGAPMFAGNINSGELNGIRIGTLKNLKKNYYLSGYIFEIGIIGKILTPEQRTMLTDFIKQHYSIN